MTREVERRRGLATLRLALWGALQDPPTVVATGPGWLLSDAVDVDPHGPTGTTGGGGASHAGRTAHGGGARSGAGYGPGRGDQQPAATHADGELADRLVALVDLARGGDAEAFGQLYDHYHVTVYRFVYHRVGSVAVAEDLTSETFFRALRSMTSFRWQGKDFGAWLLTIARNLTTDHFKAGRTRLEHTEADMGLHDAPTEGPEPTVLASLTNRTLLAALTRLPPEQQECLIMRFLQGLSIAETARVLGRSDGAVKQLQLRGVRNLAKLLPAGVR